MRWIPAFAGMTVFFCLVANPLPAAARKRPVSQAEIVKEKGELKLAFPGVKGPIPYEQFGSFENVGTDRYRYAVTDKAGLSLAAGEGIFPNNDAIKDPRYKELKGQLAGNHWTFVDTPNAELNFYKWATTSEAPGVKQFFTSVMLERAGLIEEAVKGFFAVAVHFPKTISYTYYDTPWYVGPSSLDRVEQMIRRHPRLNMNLQGAAIEVRGKFDTNIQNDAFIVTPGALKAGRKPQKAVDLSRLKVIKTVGGPKVQLRQYANRHWQLFVDEKPFPLRAITYSVTPVGRSPDRGTWDVSRDWQLIDTNNNGQHDGFFESYVDKNGNGRRDSNEPIVGDGKILKDMGVNTLRAYHHLYDQELFRKLHKDYGFYVLCGDLLGDYALGSGASWTDGTDYTNRMQRKTMLAGVRKMVEEYKDEPYILMWVLGNENVYGVASNAGKNPEAFFSLVNEAAGLIHELDPSRPVAVASGDVLFLDVMKAQCPNLDVIGANVYRGEQGFGRHLFLDVKENFDKPFLVTEYGCSAVAEGYSQKEAENYQAMYLANNWEDLEAHMAGRGEGNVLGGVVFEFMDEWWKANADLPEKVRKARADWYASRSATYKSLQPENHDAVPQFGFPFLDGWSYEEWYGLASQGEGKDSPFARTLRPAYFTLKDLWNKKQ